MTGAILTLNAGSSSIKFALFKISASDALNLASIGKIEAIETESHFTAKDARGAVLSDERWRDPAHAFQPLLTKVMSWAESHLGGVALAGIGHRVVHGGPEHDRAERVTPELMAALDRLVPLAPLHQPHNIAPMRAIAAARPTLPQVACFDTAFHRTMPAVAARFGLPRNYESEGIHRYGFHGLSYEYIAGRLRVISAQLAAGKVIVAHLGNGASLCAIDAGRSVDTTMGFTALDGLVMGTRCGSIDPGVLLYLAQQKGLDAAQIEDLLYHRSGLLGASGGLASDMRALLASDDPRARDAIELFVFRIVREVGALTSSLGGLDGLVFTAGIGEHASEIRARVCQGLGWLGGVLDPEANARNDGLISAKRSRLEIRVIPTDEEAIIARHTFAKIKSASG